MYEYEAELSYVVTIRSSVCSTESNLDSVEKELDIQAQIQSGLAELSGAKVTLDCVDMIRCDTVAVGSYLEAEDRRIA